MPGPFEVVDSLALAAGVRTLPPSALDVVVVALRFGPDGAPERVAVLDGRKDSVARRAVESVVRAALRPQGAGSGWGLRLVLIPRRPAGTLLSRSRFCPPEPPAQSLAQLRAELDTLASGRPVQLRVLVNEAGRVTHAELIGRPGSSPREGALLDIARSAQYTAARLDGDPVSAWYEIRSPM